MEVKNCKTYWDYIVKNGERYQMGGQSHRVFLLDLLAGSEPVINGRASSRIEPARSLLDVGCGTGPIYELLKFDKQKQDSKWNVIEKYKGTDYAEGMIAVCKKEFPEGDFEVQDARKMTELDKSWDAVLLMHILDHVDDYQAVLKEAARVAKKYVLLVLWRPLTTNGQNNLNSLNTYDRQEGQWEDTHLQEFSPEKLQEAFENAGLTPVFFTNGSEINQEGRSNSLYLLEV